MVSKAWNRIPSQTIRNCFRHVGFVQQPLLVSLLTEVISFIIFGLCVYAANNFTVGVVHIFTKFDRFYGTISL